MPAHYAASEFLIILAAFWCGLKCWRGEYDLAAHGISWLGLAALIGTFRILSAPNEILTFVHKTASAYGGLIGMALIALEFARTTWSIDVRVNRSLLALFALAISLAAAIMNPALTAPLILLWAGCAVVAAFVLPTLDNKVRVVRAVLISIVILNFVVVRQNPTLGPDLSWHLYHVLIAVWIWLVTRILVRV